MGLRRVGPLLGIFMTRSSSAQSSSSSKSLHLKQYLNPLQFVRNLWQYRELIQQFTRREIEGRYRGSFLGLFWSFVNPFVLLLIYTFVFGVIFKARWPEGGEGLGQYALVIFCGLIVFNIFSETINRASTLVIAVPNYVKKVIFPLEILPISALGASLFHGLVSFAILLVVNLIINGTFQWTLIFLPIIMLPLLFLCLGLGWFLASIGVFIRDVYYFVTLVTQIIFFSAAIFYPFTALSPTAQIIVRFNPLLSIVEHFRRVILWGTFPNWLSLAVWTLLTAMLMLLGYAWFMTTKKAFADVI